MSPLVAVAVALLVAGSAAAYGQNARPSVPEPEGLHEGGNFGYTPNTIRGGTVLDTSAVAKLLQAQHPLLVDVAELDRKPPNMNPDMPWLPQHRSIPGAVWLPGAGSPDKDHAFDTALTRRIAQLTDNDKARPIVVFCHPDCWGSYNAARRLISYGYRNVYWYRDGMEGWQSEHETAVIKPDADWLAWKPVELTEGK
jgi:PQQ-dependent catabolism-associated CXXCW motif protein